MYRCPNWGTLLASAGEQEETDEDSKDDEGDVSGAGRDLLTQRVMDCHHHFYCSRHRPLVTGQHRTRVQIYSYSWLENAYSVTHIFEEVGIKT